MGYSLWGCKEPDMTEQLTLTIVSGSEGNQIFNCISQGDYKYRPKEGRMGTKGRWREKAEQAGHRDKSYVYLN